MLNTTAAALVSENKTLNFPASVDSMEVDTTEDHVSMGCVSARKAMAIIANTANVLAIELICTAQAIDLHAPLAPSAPIRALRDHVRRAVPFLESDRGLSAEVAAIAAEVLSARSPSASSRPSGTLSCERECRRLFGGPTQAAVNWDGLLGAGPGWRGRAEHPQWATHAYADLKAETRRDDQCVAGPMWTVDTPAEGTPGGQRQTSPSPSSTYHDSSTSRCRIGREI